MWCFKRQRIVKQISEYINDLKDLDNTLQNMCLRIEADIKKTTRDKKITKHTLQRRLLLKRHYKNVDQRRTQILGRILQLENMHLNGLQISALKNVVNAQKDIQIDPDDVQDLLEKVNVFTEDFSDISEQLASDLTFDTEISEEELEKELNSELEFSSVIPTFPELHVLQHPSTGDVQGSVQDNKKQEITTTTYA